MKTEVSEILSDKEKLSQHEIAIPKVKPLNLNNDHDDKQGRYNTESAFFGTLPKHIVDQIDVKLTKRNVLKA